MNDERPHHDEPNEASRSAPLWVKVFGAVALAVVLLFLILMLIGSGHGPGRHSAPSANASDARVTAIGTRLDA